jgi:magnesium transporter
MIRVYTRQKDRVVETPLPPGGKPPSDALWIDLLKPSEAERLALSAALGIRLPDEAGMRQIESSSRLHVDKGAVHLTTNLVTGFEGPESALSPLLIVATPTALVTLRHNESRALTMFTERIGAQPDLFAGRDDGLLALLDAILDRMADTLEIMGGRVDDLSRRVFHISPIRRERRPQDLLHGIGRAGNMTHKIRDGIAGMVRAISFIGPTMAGGWEGERLARFRALGNDADSLKEHAQFMTNEITFLLDATLGQISIEQNKIVKVVSVVALVFGPPTLFAGIWGMNFRHIPELGWKWGYALALGVMAVSAVLPLAYFKRRGWL